MSERLAAAVLAALVPLVFAACDTRPGQSETRPGTGMPVEIPQSAGAAAPAAPAANAGAEQAADRPVQPIQPPEPTGALPPALPTKETGAVSAAPWLAGAERVHALVQGGSPFVVAAGTGWLRVYRPDGTMVAHAGGRGAAQVLELLELSPAPGGAAQSVIAVGRGLGREALDAPPSIGLYRFDGHALSPPEEVPIPATSRAQIVGIAADPERSSWLWILAFDSKYQAALLGAKRGEGGVFVTTQLARIRMPMALAAGDATGDGKTDLLIARPYGEGLDAPGDVFVLSESGQRDLLPAVRGARAVVVHGSDVLYTDGWHREYGRKANALITRARWDGRSWRSQVLAHVAGRHGYDRLRVGDVDGDGSMDVVAAGNGPAIWVRGLSPSSGNVAALGRLDAYDAFPADLDGDGRAEVIIAGPEPGIWRAGD